MAQLSSAVVLGFFVLPLAIALGALGMSIFAVIQINVAGPSVTNGTDGVNGVNGVAGVNGTAGTNGVDGTNATEPGIIMVEYYANQSASTNAFDDSVTWRKIAGITINSVPDVRFAHSDNRLTYNGTSNLIAHGFASFSFETATTNEVIRVGAAKNGTIIVPSIQERKTGAGGDIGSVSIHFMCTFAENDYIEMYALLTTFNPGDSIIFNFLGVGMMLPTTAYVGTIS